MKNLFQRWGRFVLIALLVALGAAGGCKGAAEEGICLPGQPCYGPGTGAGGSNAVCIGVNCPPGTVCQDQGGTPVCVQNLCAALNCPQGYVCEQQGSSAFCVPTGNGGAGAGGNGAAGSAQGGNAQGGAGQGGVAGAGCVPDTEVCDGQDNNCNGVADDGWGLQVPCSVGFGACNAQGEVICDGLFSTRCSVDPGAPTPEVCDGVDNDCDGSTDEGGICSQSSVELCDGIDNDGDGVVDEDFKVGNQPLGASCTVGLGVCERTGIYVCAQNHLSTTCSVVIGPAVPETCDNLDNDCDGVIDNGNPGGGNSCQTGLPGVRGLGTFVCQAGAVACVQNNAASAEVCDGLDNNCNGSIDEGNPGGGAACNTGLPGQCSQGVMSCQGGVLQCQQVVFPSGVNEASQWCDGIDNNCNGSVDEGCLCTNGTSQPCYSGPANSAGVGVCLAGMQFCNGGVWGLCVGQVLPSVELCNGEDDNCNGQTDEGTLEANKACSTGLPGICGPGTTSCNNGAVFCNEVTPPALGETCNTIDDNCNGQVDEGCGCTNGATQQCYSGPLGTAGQGQCQAGTQTCVAGSWGLCVGEIDPMAEICDSLDNDCDGVDDNGNPGGNASCLTGKFGVCAAGTSACVAGKLVCNENNPGSPNEICNGLDNNCNSSVGEGCSCVNGNTQTCYSGPPATAGVGECATGMQTCVSGQWGLCVGETLPALEICDNLDNDCNNVVDNAPVDANKACSTGLPGICGPGKTQCIAGALTCVETTPALLGELCNGADDNCNGTVDDNCPCQAGDTQPCYNGPLGTAGVGTCKAGLQTCDLQGVWSVCVGEVLPVAEYCNGLDEDCDGSVDDGNPGGNQGCSTGSSGVCSTGTTQCVGGTIVCNQNVVASTEVCDGKDNDCDGATDEGCQCVNGTQKACYDGPPATQNVGICRTGTQTCSNGVWGICAGQVLPSIEVCDGQDNNCNGGVDEGNPGGNLFCSTGLPGICSPGKTQCIAGALSCIETTPALLGELCNGLDDNCSGSVDEGCPCTNGQIQSCYSGPVGTAGVGVCKTGQQVCSLLGQWGVCAGEVDPGVEICNGKDDNCNGQTDEGNPGGNVSCSTGKLGVCAAGLTSCNAGTLTCVQQNPGSVVESPSNCNGLDDNCNGTVDDGCTCVTGTTQPCYAGPNNTVGVGVCSAGLQTCAANGTWGACAGQVLPSVEQCDGLDNNCNGVADNGNPGGGASCTTGNLGVCQFGTTACQAGVVVCVQNQAASAEVCNGLDDDCDGVADEGNPGGGAACNTGKLGACAAGVRQCLPGGALTCVQVTPSVAENNNLICHDGVENDCDGLTDCADANCAAFCP